MLIFFWILSSILIINSPFLIGADLDNTYQTKDISPVLRLITTAQIGNKRLMSQLLACASSHLNDQNRYGFTPLMEACGCGHPEIVELLLAAGANPNIRNHKGYTALMIATFWSYEPIVQQLLAHPNIQVHLTNNEGKNALSYASLTCIKTMLQKRVALS